KIVSLICVAAARMVPNIGFEMGRQLKSVPNPEQSVARLATQDCKSKKLFSCAPLPQEATAQSRIARMHALHLGPGIKMNDVNRRTLGAVRLDRHLFRNKLQILRIFR